MNRILIVDDEEKIRTIIKKYAEYEGYETDEAAGGVEAISKVRRGSYSLIIMDIMMPDIDGFECCTRIRSICSSPIIMLSAKGEEYDKLHGFELGVDDYVVKPFSPKELMYRIKAILTRSGVVEKESAHDVFSYQGLYVDCTSRIVKIDGQEKNLTPREYDLLFYLIKNRGIALTREKLITEVWGYDYYGGDRTLDTHIKLLRRSLGKYRNRLVTLRGVGYRFEM